MKRETNVGKVRPHRSTLSALALATLLLVTSCGGGGEAGDNTATTVTFEGFAFRLGDSLTVESPPIEDLGSEALSLGAPLNTVVIFRFSDVPAGPFNSSTLPVYTTSTWITSGVPTVPGAKVKAKGSYVAVDHTVEFRPFIPTEPLDIQATISSGAVPGLYPESLYAVEVSTTAGESIGNLVGPGGSAVFGTTSIEAAYYPPSADPFGSPKITAASDAPLAAGLFDDTPYGFPATTTDGASAIELTYDRALTPSASNVNGDSEPMPTWTLRAPSSEIFIGHVVPAASTVGSTSSFPALSALAPGLPPALDGSDILVGSDPFSPWGEPQSMAFDHTGSLLFVLIGDTTSNQRLAVVDHGVGDPRHAQLGDAALGVGSATLGALTTTVDGTMLAIDRDARRVVEVRAHVTRSLPHGVPQLDSVTVGPDDGAFAGQPWPAEQQIVDLISTASGDIWALVETAPAGPRQLVNTLGFDLNATGTPADTSCWPTDEVILDGLSASILDIEFESESTVLALDADLDAVVRINLANGTSTPLIVGVGAFGTSPETSPLRCLARASALFDVAAVITKNEAEQAIVELYPRGVLPLGTTLDVMQSLALTSLLGANDINVPDAPPRHRLGRKRIHAVTSSQPTVAAGDVVHDVFIESFDDTEWLDSTAADVIANASWAAALADGTPSSALQSLSSSSLPVSLGDFHPLPSLLFDASKEFSNNPGLANLTYIYLNTGSQAFPLLSGATPDVTEETTVGGGNFVFDDFIVPEGVIVKIVGPNPCSITTTGQVIIHGVVDVSGVDGLGDDTFDTGFYPVPGGAGGPGGGRGGNGHPTLWDPSNTNTLDQYVTPETGEQGYGPQLLPAGNLAIIQNGGRGGLSTLGYDPDGNGFPRVPVQLTQLNTYNGNEHHRPPGGGGGSFAQRGQQAHEGTGAYLVQSSSTWFPFSRCPTNDKQRDAVYGNETNLVLGATPNTPLQCVYLDGPIEAPNRKKPGGLPGDEVFIDGDDTNDFIGAGGEIPRPMGGQGGGAGGSRVDSLDHTLWAADKLGSPVNAPPSPLPPYPRLAINSLKSPTMFDAKGGAGGGGGGALQIRSFRDVVVGRTGRINASGGKGGGGEIVQASSWAGGGGGGSGGAVLITAKGAIVLEADPDNRLPTVPDANGARGATIDVSGGLGKDARTSPRYHIMSVPESGHASRSDGGQGGFGIVQMRSGEGYPRIEQGAFVHARLRAMAKLGAWTDPLLDKNKGAPFNTLGANPPASDHPYDKSPHPQELWYFDLLHYRGFVYEDGGKRVRDLILNGCDPPLIKPHASVPSGNYQLDTPMMDYLGRRYVREPQPQLLLATWFGLDGTAEILADPDGDGPAAPAPGILYSADDVLPLSIALAEPDGTPLKETVAGAEQFMLSNLVPRLPLVHPDLVPFDLGLISEGRSRWLDFSGMTLRTRNGDGRTPPFFAAAHGTHASDGFGVLAGELVTGAPIPGKPASYVKNTPGAPFDPGLTVDGIATSEPFNDIKVDAPELSTPNALSNGASVRWLFQGAFGTRHGASTPDPATISEWTGDLASLTGYPLVRYRVLFDIDAASPLATNEATFPRPSVDTVRIRMTY